MSEVLKVSKGSNRYTLVQEDVGSLKDWIREQSELEHGIIDFLF